MKYKVGDKVRIKSIDWYNENKNDNGYVYLRIIFTPKMSKYCGQVTTIIGAINNDEYKIALDNGCYNWTDDMIEGLVEDLLDKEIQEHQKICNEALTIKGIEPTEEVWHCPEGYQFVDENGNVINTQKIVLEKKGKKYPETYKECCEVLDIIDNRETWLGYRPVQLKIFQEILICRDAYWKIAGDEMGLGKPWEPDWKDEDETKWVIFNLQNKIKLATRDVVNAILAFPTSEMRDAFYENFKELIEICKELL